MWLVVSSWHENVSCLEIASSFVNSEHFMIASYTGVDHKSDNTASNLWRDYQFKTHSSRIMGIILMLSCVIAIVSAAVDDSNGSTGSNKTPVPTNKSGIPVIVNVNHDSRNIEKTIKSLETTLEKNFQQLISVINSTFGGNRPEKPGKICLIMFKVVVFY